MSWCCLISGDERSAIKTLGYARNDDAREALSKLRGASLFLCAAPLPPYPLNLLNPLNLYARNQRAARPRGLSLKAGMSS